MRKNFTLLFLIGIFGLFTTNLFAQQDATIDPADIRYWIGEGEKSVIFAVNWNDPDTALAWGYRYNTETLLVKDVMDAIAATDPRFDYQGAGGMVNEITFNDGNVDLHLVGMWWMYNVNGMGAGLGYDAMPLIDGDFIKFGDESCGIITDPELWTYVWVKEVVAVYPYAQEAMIDPSQIVYWIGEGENEVVFAVNWADPDICLAWGYRFSTPDVTVKTVMDAIAEADGRFGYEVGAWGVTDITFNDGELDLGVVEFSYFMYNVNGDYAWYGYDEQTVMNGDFVKFGDVACGTEIAEWTYVWETSVQPVPVYNTVAENMSSVSLYPNPASSYTMLSVSNMEQAVVTVSDLQGRVVNSFAVASSNEPIRIETAGFKAGLYFVTVSNEMSHYTTKLFVK